MVHSNGFSFLIFCPQCLSFRYNALFIRSEINSGGTGMCPVCALLVAAVSVILSTATSHLGAGRIG